MSTGADKLSTELLEILGSLIMIFLSLIGGIRLQFFILYEYWESSVAPTSVLSLQIKIQTFHKYW